LSHYLPYDLARCVDEQTAQAIMACAEIADHHHACGATPINGLLEVARGRGLRVAQLDLRNSGDMAGDHRRVVGYGAWAFYEPEVVTAEEAPPIHAARGDALLALARGAIAHELGVGARPRIASDFLRAPGASFVTLRIDGQLRGCIGSLQAQRPLGEDIEHNARAAAFADPRFSPLSADELPRTHIEVSVLSAPQPMDVHSLADLLAQLRPHVDGLILSAGARRATFLPQVWEQLPAPRDFVAQLQQKAGLPVGSWPGDMQAARYTVESFAELEQ
jgi:AmmeMemoRadiSam system protein A